MADSGAVLSLAEQLQSGAATAGHRRLLVLAGDPDWGRGAAQTVCEQLEPPRSLWLGRQVAQAGDAIAPAGAMQYLGNEIDLLVFDAHDGLDPDAFAAITGTLAGGGLLLLLVPALADWPSAPDPERRRLAIHPVLPEEVGGRFLARLAAMLTADAAAVVVGQGAPVPQLASARAVPAAAVSSADCRTADQAAAVDAVVHLATGHPRRPLVLTADRGRGKSAALGIAAARLLANSGRGVRVLVTAPRRSAVDAVFDHAARRLPDAAAHGNVLSARGGSLAFAAPDALLHAPRAADLLMVDEAAALPLGLLERLATRYPRAVFSSTVHGYEGSGRGFAVRFGQTLDQIAPGWNSMHLEAPVRWASGDPLEAFVFRSLLLDAEPAPLPAGWQPPGDWRIERLDRDALAGDEELLREVFGLLVGAHYRTTPMDLRHLLDGPNLEVRVARAGGLVVGTALLAMEGGFDRALAAEVWAGRRRPRGHLLPQALALHAGEPDACTLGALRIIRLAVHPALRRRGIGAALVESMVSEARVRGLDLAGVSFAATPELVHFWRHSEMTPVRVGARRETTSGAHSVLMVRGLSEEGGALCGRARKAFLRDLPLELGDALRDLDPSLVAAVATETEAGVPHLAPDDLRLLEGFARERRLFEPTRAALVRLVSAVLPVADAWDAAGDVGRTALVTRVLQARAWEACAHAAGVAGRDALIGELRRAVGCLLDHLRGAASSAAGNEGIGG